ncbi:MAG TPA: sugar transferase [Bryobacterales bacterium]|nr:sugar transferase [Bryobacterales bacterium]
MSLKLALPLALGFAFLAAIYVRFYSGWMRVQDLPAWPAYIVYFAVSMALWSALEARAGLIYKCCERISLARWLWSLAQIDFLTLALVSAATFFWRTYSFSRFTVTAFWILHFLLCAGIAAALRAWARRQAGPAAPWVFLIGEDLDLDSVRRECLPEAALGVCRRFRDAAGALEALEAFEPSPDCSEILVAVPAQTLARTGEWLAPVIGALERLPIPASVVLHGALGGVSPCAVYATPSFVVLSTSPQAAGAFDYVFSKRVIDLTVAAAALVLLAPVLAVIAAVIWLRSGRPVLLAQERVGRLGRPFRLYKFRTLPPSTLADAGHRWAAPATDAWGRFLRSTGLDELPQLFNVLRGEMSLVGPRPERPHFVEQFRRRLPFYSTRHRFQVGITGWAQVNGWRGDTSIPRRVEHDLYYLRHWSLALDLRILWMTVTDFSRRLWAGVAALRTAASGAALRSAPMPGRSEKASHARPV